MQAQSLSQEYGLSGRIDLYFAFILGISQVLKPNGTAGIIVSNRFMTTKGGASIRENILRRLHLKQVWDLGDTKLFDAAVLPAVLLAEGKNGQSIEVPRFSSIYEVAGNSDLKSSNPIEALSLTGVVELTDGRCDEVRHGNLNTSGSLDGVWRVATEKADTWLKTVADHTWGTFRDIGKIRVGVKTCADKIFIRSDWQLMSDDLRPELLRPLITHHCAQRFKALAPKKVRQILYPHTFLNDRRAPVDLAKFPKSGAYLRRNRQALEKRKYVIEAGRGMV